MTSPTTSDPAHPADPAPTRGRSAALLLAVIAASAIVAVGLGAAFGPHHQTVSTSQTGNERLADSIQSLPGSFDGFRSLSVAEIGPNGPVFAGIGDADPAHSGAPGPDTVFELGSITKTFTGALFADAVERGEVSPDDPLSQYLDALTGTPAGAVTLASLSQHSSGLPGLGETAVASTLESLLLNENPYASTSTEQLIADAAVAPVDRRPGTRGCCPRVPSQRHARPALVGRGVPPRRISDLHHSIRPGDLGASEPRRDSSRRGSTPAHCANGY